jgi:release factor glutamine methyltransferase
MDKTHTAAAETEVWSIGRLLEWTDRFLAGKGSRSPRLDTQVLLAHALACTRMELYTRFHEPASIEARERFRELVRRRSEGCPVAYLVGRKEFYSLAFEVEPTVLIPRPATETLVMECLRFAGKLPEPAIADIGTGSGNIAIAIAHQKPQARVTATDLSAAALELARRNAVTHKVADRVRFFQGDLLEPIPSGEKFDFVLSNPPYVARDELQKLEKNVRDYEPLSALDGGISGLAVIDRLIDQARAYLKPGGHLLIEIAPHQDEKVRGRFAAGGGYDVGKTFPDGDGLPRVAWARRIARNDG